MSLGNLGTFTGRKGADKEQCRLTDTHTHTPREEERRDIELLRKTHILWRRAMINLATQRLVFVAAKSNSPMLAIFSVVCGICYFCACVRECVGGAEIGRQSLGIVATNSVGPIQRHEVLQFWITSRGRCDTTGSI